MKTLKETKLRAEGRFRLGMAAILLLLAAFSLGVWLGPDIRLARQAWVLDRHPDFGRKLVAAGRLSHSNDGMHLLYQRLTSRDPVVRDVCAYVIGDRDSPWSAVQALYALPRSDEFARVELLNSMGYGWYQHQFMIDLDVEAKLTRSAKVRQEIERIVDADRQEVLTWRRRPIGTW